MKQLIKQSILALIIATLGLGPSESKAAIGIGTGFAPLIYAGIGVVGGGTVAIISNNMTKWTNSFYEKDFFWAGLTVVFGVVLLDGEKGQEVQFAPLTEAQAKVLKVTTAELSSYNSEIDQINILLSEASDRLSELPAPSVGDSAKVWDELKENLSTEAFSVMVKIVSQQTKK